MNPPPSPDETHITLTNKTREKINRYLMRNESKKYTEILRIPHTQLKSGLRIPSMILWEGAPVECYKTNRKYKIYNNQGFTVQSWNYEGSEAEDSITIKDDETYDLYIIPLTDFNYLIRSGFAITCHRAQGKTIQGKIRIYDTDHPHMTKRWLYTAVSRTTDFDNLSLANLCPANLSLTNINELNSFGEDS